jgi:hypothetical protein
MKATTETHSYYGHIIPVKFFTYSMIFSTIYYLLYKKTILLCLQACPPENEQTTIPHTHTPQPQTTNIFPYLFPSFI